MSRLEDARARLRVATDALLEIRVMVRDASLDVTNLDAAAFLDELATKLGGDIDTSINGAQSAVSSLIGEDLAADASRRDDLAKALVANALSVSRDDMEVVVAGTMTGLEELADSLERLQVEPVDSAQLQALVDKFNTDIQNQQEFSAKLSRIVGTVTKIGGTAVKLLSPVG